MNEERERPYHVRTVAQFTAGMAEWFEKNRWLERVGIRGEVTDLRSFGGHLGFTLKEDRIVMQCIAWSGAREHFPELKNGDEIIAYGAVAVDRKFGGYKLYATSAELAGVGNLYRLYEELKEKFSREGLFDVERKRPVPQRIRRVALVTARDGKGAQDFIKTLRDDVPFVHIVLIETRVQGEGSEIDIAEAIDRAGRSGVDAIVVARGGGSYIERFPFNREPVVRAIVRATVPVFTAIGHEPDRHLADDVADLVFGTPSKAAAFIVAAWLSAFGELNQRMRDLERLVKHIVLGNVQLLQLRSADLERCALRLLGAKSVAFSGVVGRLERRKPERVLADSRAALLRHEARLETAARVRIERGTRALSDRRTTLGTVESRFGNNLGMRVQRAIGELDKFDPLAPLGRGYAIVSAGGLAVRDASSLRPGDAIQARLERGTLAARVEAVNEDG